MAIAPAVFFSVIISFALISLIYIATPPTSLGGLQTLTEVTPSSIYQTFYKVITVVLSTLFILTALVTIQYAVKVILGKPGIVDFNSLSRDHDSDCLGYDPSTKLRRYCDRTTRACKTLEGCGSNNDCALGYISSCRRK